MLTFAEIRRFDVPPNSMALWWLGQSGFIIKSPGGRVVVLDPYLSDSCKELGAGIGFNMSRQVPPPMRAEELVGVDAYILTHTHQDHLDPVTLASYLQAGGMGPFVAPIETTQKLHSLGVPEDRCRLVWPNQLTEVGDLQLRATFAIPFAGDDLTHVGYLVSASGGPRIYFTGDTGYHSVLAAAVGPHKPDILVAVINGAFRNMSAAEAATLAKELEVRMVIPCHHDLFPDNSVPPRLLRTNLHILGIADRYLELTHGKAQIFSS